MTSQQVRGRRAGSGGPTEPPLPPAVVADRRSCNTSSPSSSSHPASLPCAPQELIFLGVVAVAVALGLSTAYARIAQARLDAWVAERSNRAAGTAGNIGSELMWQSIFQTNFWFFIVFGALQHGLLPQLLPQLLDSTTTTKTLAYVQGGIAAGVPLLGAIAVASGVF